MKIMVVGGNGYIGIPLVARLYQKYGFQNVVVVDNYARFDWVSNVLGERQPETNFTSCIHGDFTERDFVDEMFKIHRPDVVINLASQPSMPYSHLSWERAVYTQGNNLMINLNILWGLKENGLLKSRHIITTTTGIPGQLYQVVPEAETLNKAGSWYHISRGFDSENCNLAARLWGLQTIEFRTSIVYGVKTRELRENCWHTRFDTDPYFGTVINRFISQAMHGKPITLYGQGNQTKPFVYLEDCIESIVNSIDDEFPSKHTIINQVSECISIKELATQISKRFNSDIHYLPNPRNEKEDFEMIFDNREFCKVLGRPYIKFEDGIEEMIQDLKYGK